MSRYINLPKSQLNNLYWNQKRSSRMIAKLFSCDPATIRARLRSCGLRVRTPQEASRYRPYTLPRETRYPRRDFDGDDAHKAYLIGFRLGDLTVTPSSAGRYSQTIEVKGRTTRPEQICLFKRLFSSYGHFHQCQDRHGATYLICCLNRS